MSSSSFARSSFFWRVMSGPAVEAFRPVPSWHASDGGTGSAGICQCVLAFCTCTVISQVPSSFLIKLTSEKGNKINPFPAPWWGAINFTIELERDRWIPPILWYKEGGYGTQDVTVYAWEVDTHWQVTALPVSQFDTCQEGTGLIMPLQQGQGHHSPEGGTKGHQKLRLTVLTCTCIDKAQNTYKMYMCLRGSHMYWQLGSQYLHIISLARLTVLTRIDKTAHSILTHNYKAHSTCTYWQGSQYLHISTRLTILACIDKAHT